MEVVKPPARSSDIGHCVLAMACHRNNGAPPMDLAPRPGLLGVQEIHESFSISLPLRMWYFLNAGLVPACAVQLHFLSCREGIAQTHGKYCLKLPSPVMPIGFSPPVPRYLDCGDGIPSRRRPCPPAPFATGLLLMGLPLREHEEQLKSLLMLFPGMNRHPPSC